MGLTYQGKRVLLVGFGILGQEMLKTLEDSGADVVGVLDDRNSVVPDHLEHLGPVSVLPNLLEQGSCDVVVLAASLISAKTIS